MTRIVAVAGVAVVAAMAVLAGCARGPGAMEMDYAKELAGTYTGVIPERPVENPFANVPAEQIPAPLAPLVAQLPPMLNAASAITLVATDIEDNKNSGTFTFTLTNTVAGLPPGTPSAGIVYTLTGSLTIDSSEISTSGIVVEAAAQVNEVVIPLPSSVLRPDALQILEADPVFGYELSGDTLKLTNVGMPVLLQLPPSDTTLTLTRQPPS